ncbi:wee1-like protein kinase [Dorcoceras hygrometricum]|uniref:Wee1-like protein kinase n=1 Tax=Dorcoceras hygrometricum TaxID=472368 RepID=A0A2Z7D0H6_9LAMI|nr:wee1-like protein kinase [Dorcoceras hygrometricum]
MSSDFFWKCCVFENFASLKVVGTRRSEFDEIGQQQVTVAKSTRVNDTVACGWSNLEFQSLRLYWLLLEVDARGVVVLILTQISRCKYVRSGSSRGRCEGERQYRTLISLLRSLATMRRVVNYHSSWARQRQVELFDASGNPGFTAGRGYNPAGGAPGGG